ncbi:TonB-dependent receptor, partial [Candidatus Symbiopectobacterium sp. NZEC135]|nr:TonB-dependent receptor [Candidatus Symbiopectobacterium sp. NZEC135]
WGVSVADLYTPTDGLLFDSLNSKLFFSKTEAHDYTISNAASPTQVWSGYDTNTVGLESKATKEWRNHRFSYGVNLRQSESERPLVAKNILAGAVNLGRPQADSKIINAGAFVQDKMTWDVAGRDFSVIPAVRFAWQHAKPENTDNLFTNTSGNVTASDTAKMYGTNADGQILPALTFQYN